MYIHALKATKGRKFTELPKTRPAATSGATAVKMTRFGELRFGEVRFGETSFGEMRFDEMRGTPRRGVKDNDSRQGGG
jgi:hypothetical protein